MWRPIRASRERRKVCAAELLSDKGATCERGQERRGGDAFVKSSTVDGLRSEPRLSRLETVLDAQEGTRQDNTHKPGPGQWKSTGAYTCNSLGDAECNVRAIPPHVSELLFRQVIQWTASLWCETPEHQH